MEKDKKLQQVLQAGNQVILDKEREIQLCLACLLSQGHLLIEDRPGMGKTTLVKTLAKLLGLESQRIQFTNDLLPADILGTTVFNQQTREFEFHKGPIFANFILADEVNRATPKTQSACLQAMEEGSVSMDGQLYTLPEPFFLVATQNPQENIGTFPLPESQIDRFLMRIELGLPSREAERRILTGDQRSHMIEDLKPLMSPEDLKNWFNKVEQVHMSDGILDYLQDVIEKARTVANGVSPRAAKDLHRVSKAWALIEGRDFVIPEDLQAVTVSVLNHRLKADNGHSQTSGFELAREIIQSVPVK
ncbi:MAG: AAA family ATPase [Bdellovibrionaceae bacterium]|nr:AAA family ATPase [Pseudobdellovibrionaceae bacterium]